MFGYDYAKGISLFSFTPRDAIEGLLEKGILRTTIDEKHFDFAYHA